MSAVERRRRLDGGVALVVGGEEIRLFFLFLLHFFHFVSPLPMRKMP
jgi:hypothetical protein